MKKTMQIIIGLVLIVGVVFIFLYLEEIFAFFNVIYDELLVNLILLNIIVYLIRTILLRFTNYFLSGKFSRYILSMIINIVWAGFLFVLIAVWQPLIFPIIISFLATAIGFTAKDRINNIVAGISIYTSGAFKVGDLIEVKGIQGIVQEITLNHTKIRRNDGLFHFIPNAVIYNAAVKKFTHSKEYEYSPEEVEQTTGGEESILKKYTTKISEIIAKGERITRYIKVVEILAKKDPETIDNLLSKVFDQYEKLFEFRPFYYVNNTFMDRCSITLQIVTKRPKLIQLYLNSFLRDILYALYEEDIYFEWDKERLIVPTKLKEVK